MMNSTQEQTNCNKVEYSECANQEPGRIKISKLRISRNNMSISEFRSDKIKKNNRNSIFEYIKGTLMQIGKSPYMF